MEKRRKKSPFQFFWAISISLYLSWGRKCTAQSRCRASLPRGSWLPRANCGPGLVVWWEEHPPRKQQMCTGTWGRGGLRKPAHPHHVLTMLLTGDKWSGHRSKNIHLHFQFSPFPCDSGHGRVGWGDGSRCLCDLYWESRGRKTIPPRTSLPS